MVLRVIRVERRVTHHRAGSELGTFHSSNPSSADTIVVPPTPPGIRLLNQVMASGMLVLSLTGIVGLYVGNFVPSQMTVQATKAASILIGCFYALAFLGIGQFGWTEDNPRVRKAMQNSKAVRTAWIRVPMMSLVFAGFAWLTFSHVLPWAANAAIGTNGEMVVVVDGWEGGGRYCARPTLRDIPFGMLGRRALCVLGRRHGASEFPPGTSIAITGRASIFGIAPDYYRKIQSPSP